MGVAAVGTEILVNTTTTGSQQQPVIANLAGGGLAMAWTDGSMSGADTSGNAVRAQVFDAAGARVRTEILVNTATTGSQLQPQITPLPGGGFVVIWNDISRTAPDITGYAVRAQVFDAAGGPVGTEILVNSVTAGDQTLPQLTTLTGGGFVAIWRDGSATAPDASGLAVRAQTFAADGTRVGAEILVNTATAGGQDEGRVAALPGGGFVVTWRDASATGGDTSGSAVRSQMFAADGTPVGGETLVNTFTAGSQGDPRIATLSDGGFVIVWSDDSAGQTGQADIRAQVLDGTGSPLGSEMVVNTTTTGNQAEHEVAALAGGGFVVTWRDESDGGSYGVRAQVFGATGARVGSEFLVNTTTLGAQNAAQVVGLPNGGFVVTWQDQSQSGGDTSGWAVRAQAYTATGARSGSEVLVNTATSGDQTIPQIAPTADGFVIAWRDDSRSGGDLSGYAVRAQRFTLNNDAPQGADATMAGTAVGARVLSASDFGFTDVNGDDLAAVRIATLPTAGTLTSDGVAVTAGQSVSAADIAAGKLVYTPAQAGAFSFTFQVRDDGGTANGGADLDPSANTLTINVGDRPVVAGLGGIAAAQEQVPVAVVPDLTVSDADSATLASARISITAGLVQAEDRLAFDNTSSTTFGNVSAVYDPATGVLSLTSSGATATLAQWQAALRAVTYTNLSDTPAAAARTLSVTVDDGTYGSLAVTRQLTVADVYDPPPPPPYVQPSAPDAPVAWSGSGTDEAASGAAGPDRLSGQGGTDTLSGGGGDDEVYGNTGNDVLNGNQGNDVVRGGQDDDIVRGGQGDDFVFGDKGADLVFGDLGSDYVEGGEGDDILWGGGGPLPGVLEDLGDTLSGGAGSDYVNGNAGDDRVDAGSGNDTAQGGRGNDLVLGRDGDDMVFGDLGNDTLSGGPGTDLLIGGAGADVFRLAPGDGADAIVDFSFADGDRLDLAGQPYTLGHAPDGSALLTLAGGGTLLLQGVADFRPEFLFA